MIETELDIAFPEHGVRLGGKLYYEPADPYAVHLLIRQESELTHWQFARDLLKRGTDLRIARAGEGDVEVFTYTYDRTYIRLKTREDSALLMLDRYVLMGFIRHVYAAVPLGAEGESADIGKELSELFGGEASP